MDRSDLAPLGLGLAALGRPAYITAHRAADFGIGARTVDVMRGRAHELLDAAWAGGIRFIDAARSYGLAEEFLGSWLAAHPERRGALTIESKWGYEYVGGWRMDADVHERKEHSRSMFERQWPETLAAIGSAPDLFLIHSLTPDSPALADGPLLDRLRRLAASGVRVGVSTSGPRQGDALDAARELDDSPFRAVQATWNLLEPSAAPALQRAHDAGWLVVVKEAVANGRLAPLPGSVTDASGASVTESSGDHASDRVERELLPALAFADGQSLDALAIGAARTQPWADVVLSGAVTPAQLTSNLAARAPGAAARERFPRLAESPEAYWSARSSRAWT